MLLSRYKSAFSGALVTFLVIQVLSGCLVADPWIETVVHETRGEMTFEFFVLERRWWSGRLERVSHKAAYLIIGDSKMTVWEIKSRDEAFAVREIRYGVLPEGFEQVIPKNGKPPPLKSGAEYQLAARYRGGGGTTTFVYQAPK